MSSRRILVITLTVMAWLRQTCAGDVHMPEFEGKNVEGTVMSGDSRYFVGKSEVSSSVILTGTYGVISTPNYPQPYPEFSTFIWEIRLDVAYTSIQFLIRDFNVMLTDQLIIRATNLVEDITLTKDIILPHSITVPSNEVTLVFTSDQRLFPSRGLHVEYYGTPDEHVTSLFVGEDYTTWLSFMSPNYPSNYADNANLMWTITSGPSTYICLDVVSMDLETGFDFLAIYDGDATTSNALNPLATLSGTGGKNLEFITSQNVATVSFMSDHSMTMEGFKIRYKPYRRWSQCASNTTIRLTDGVLQNEGWPGLNFDIRTCQWLLSMDSGKRIHVYLDRVNFAFGIGSLTFYDGSSTSDSILWTSSGSSSLDFEDAAEIISLSNEILVLLDVYDDQYYEYFCRFHEEDIITQGSCNLGIFLTESVGEIKSFMYPRTAPADTQCFWTIQYEQGATVYLQMMKFSINNAADSVLFYRDLASNSLVKGCGVGYDYCSTGDQVISDTNVMTIKSNAISSSSIFKFLYRKDSGSIIIKDDEYSGTAVSPLFPQNYPNNLYHVYYIEVPDGKILFDFLQFDTESCCDIVYVYDGNTTSSPLITTLSGTQSGYGSTTSGPNLVLEFVTDSSVTRTGFEMEYSSADGSVQGVANTAYSYSTYNMARYEFDSNKRHFASPSSAGFYPGDSDFYWYNTCPSSVFDLLFTFYRVDVDDSDFLNLYRGIGTNDLHSSISSKVDSYETTYWASVTGGSSTVWFHTNERFSGLGFYFRYQCVEN